MRGPVKIKPNYLNWADETWKMLNNGKKGRVPQVMKSPEKMVHSWRPAFFIEDNQSISWGATWCYFVVIAK
jgi:hypothetical protein